MNQIILERVHIRFRVFGRTEVSTEKFARSVVNKSNQGSALHVSWEPEVRASVDLYKLSTTRSASTQCMS